MSNPPEAICDPVLGKLDFVCALDAVNEYSCTTTIGGHKVQLDLYTDANGKLLSAIKRARRIIEGFPAIQAKMHKFIERIVYPQYTAQLHVNKRPYTLQQVLRKLKLRFVSIHSEPKATFWFDADGIFLGHSLQLTMGPRNVFIDYDTPG